jgi:hypothetical protein
LDPKYDPIADRGAEMPNHNTTMRSIVPRVHDSSKLAREYKIVVFTKRNSARGPRHEETKVKQEDDNENDTIGRVFNAFD